MTGGVALPFSRPRGGHQTSLDASLIYIYAWHVALSSPLSVPLSAPFWSVSSDLASSETMSHNTEPRPHHCPPGHPHPVRPRFHPDQSVSQSVSHSVIQLFSHFRTRFSQPPLARGVKPFTH